MRTASQLYDLLLHAERDLLRYPGVTGVGFGWKEARGEVLELPALRVYVRRKCPRSELRRAQIIPEWLAGIATDVLPARIGVPAAALELGCRAPLTSGLAVTNLKGVLGRPAGEQGGTGLGTIGFIAAENGTTDRMTTVLVSNRHVLLAHGARKGDPVYQPKFSSKDGVCVLRADSLDPVAEIHDEGFEENLSYGYPGEPSQEYFVDCATARVLTERGICAAPTLPPPGIRGKTRVPGVARVYPLDALAGRPLRVYKIGQATGVTVGRVVDVAAPVELCGKARRHNNIIIRAERRIGAEKAPFVEAGDSGALIMNDRGEAVGLLWGKSDRVSTEAYACHIHPVLHRLRVTLVTHDLSLRPWRRQPDRSRTSAESHSAREEPEDPS
jgi:hypothetical protein